MGQGAHEICWRGPVLTVCDGVARQADETVMDTNITFKGENDHETSRSQTKVGIA
jgi:hypothetical protein